MTPFAKLVRELDRRWPNFVRFVQISYGNSAEELTTEELEELNSLLENDIEGMGLFVKINLMMLLGKVETSDIKLLRDMGLVGQEVLASSKEIEKLKNQVEDSNTSEQDREALEKELSDRKKLLVQESTKYLGKGLQNIKLFMS